MLQVKDGSISKFTFSFEKVLTLFSQRAKNIAKMALNIKKKKKKDGEGSLDMLNVFLQLSLRSAKLELRVTRGE